RADDVRAEYLAVLLAAYDLDEALGLVRRAGAAVGAEGKAAGLVLELLFLALVLGQSEAGDLRMAVRDARDVVVHDRLRLVAGDGLGGVDALVAALVREHRRSGDVADAVDTLGARLERLRVDLHEAAVGQLHAGFLESHVLG